MQISSKKILYVDSAVKAGGGQIIVVMLIDGLGEDFDVSLATPGSIDIKGAKSIVLSRSGFWGKVIEIRSFYKQGKFDLVHAHGTRAAAWARLAAIGCKHPPIVYTLHGFHIARKKSWMRPALLFAERFLNKWVAKLICVSESDKELAERFRIIDPRKILLIRNGIEASRFNLAKEEVDRWKKDLGMVDKLVVGVIARLNQPKDFKTLLRAVKIAEAEVSNLHVLIAGEGPLREQIERDVRKLRLEKRVTLLGWYEDIPSLITGSDIIVLSSRWEGLPLTPLEAGAGARPVIASDSGGTPETVLHGKTGYLFKVGQVDQLAEYLVELANSSSKRQQMGNAARNFVKKNFNKKDMIAAHKNLYHSL